MVEKKVTDYIKKYDMIHPGDSVIAAVSGGADSVALLLLLEGLSGKMDFHLLAVHVEHGIRGEESLADMRFTQELCEKLGIPVKVYHVNAPECAARQGIGLEEAARILRYRALENAADELTKKTGKRGAIKIALAHHMQDQAETVLFRLARGSGIQGLSGMQPVRQCVDIGIQYRQACIDTEADSARQEDDDTEPDSSQKNAHGYTYIRPLLGVSRGEIEEYLAARGQNHCVDSTNLDESYARNRIRNRVIPELTEVNSRAAAHIAQAAEQAAEITDYISAEARRELRRIASAEKIDSISHKTEEKGKDAEEVRRISIDIPELLRLHPALQKEILRQALILTAGHEKDLAALHVKQLLELTQKTSGKEVLLPYRVKAMREFDRLVLVRPSAGEDERMAMEKKKMTGDIFLHLPKKEEAGQSTGMQEETSNVIFLSEGRLEEAKLTGEPVEIELGSSEKLILRICRVANLANQKKTGKETNSPVNTKMRRAASGMSDLQYFAFEKLAEGVFLRHRRPGDYFCMKDGHRKKLKQYLIEEEIPASERQDLWLLARGPRVIWLIGRRVDPFFLPDMHTEYVVTAER